MSREKDVRKSNFAAVTSLLTTDYMDIVRSGQNLKITTANMLTFFGVSGPLETKGEVTATPVLDVDAGTNYIRNLAAGAGIGLALTAQEAIQISHNFTIDKTGKPLILNEADATPDVVSLVAGTGVTLTPNANTIEISVGASAATQLVNVYSASDFPAPSVGIITLADDTEYLIHNDITVSERFITGANTVLTGLNSSIITLAYSGASNMFTIIDKSIHINNITLSATGGTMFQWEDSGQAYEFEIHNSKIFCQNFGTFDDGKYFHFEDVEVEAISGTGMAFGGAFEIGIFHNTQWEKASGAQTIIDLGTATFDTLIIDKMTMENDGTGYCVAGAAASANINAGGVGTVRNFLQRGSSVNLFQNISDVDDRWQFIGNAQFANSKDVALSTHAGATLTISGATTPVIVGATWTSQVANRFTATAGGRWTYNGNKTRVTVTCNISASIATATDNCSFFLYKGGVQIAATRTIRSLTAGTISNITLIWELALSNAEYLELWAQNDDASVNIIISSAKMRISA